MKLLAIDTALEACSTAVLDGDRVLASCVQTMARGHQERLAPLAEAAMRRAGLAFAELDRIAVTAGPGSFTGLRVGVAFARSAALALGVPCVGVGTLEALMLSSPAARAPLAGAVLDARGGHVHLQLFASGIALTPPTNLALHDALALLARHGAGAATPLVGSGAPLLRPDAASEVQIDPVALGRRAQQLQPDTNPPDPLYLRAPDARTLADRAAAASPA